MNEKEKKLRLYRKAYKALNEISTYINDENGLYLPTEIQLLTVIGRLEQQKSDEKQNAWIKNFMDKK